MLGLFLGLATRAISYKRELFSPAELFANGEQGVWYDPSDFSTMFQDSAGTIPVTAVEQPVGRILDKSGRGNHATQATVPKRPILKIDGNGKYYLKFDGIDDAMQTGNIDFTGTDKMTVFAGVRKLSDAATGMICELSATSGVNPGAILFSHNTNAGYGFRSHGTAVADANSSTPLSPITNVITGLGNISGDSAILRINGAQVAQSTADQGTGKYGNYPLFIGSRGGTTLPFNGHLYSLIVRGAQSSEAQILSAETYCNQKTGAY